MEVGGHRLFHYTDAALAMFEREGGEGPPCPWVEYQVVRLWEDLIQILPSALDPVPEPLLPLARLSERQRSQWEDQVWEWVSTKEWQELVFQVTGWSGSRFLDTSHLRSGARRSRSSS